MTHETPSILEDDLELARAVAAGSAADLIALQSEHANALITFLVGRGAQPADAEDIVATVFAQAVSSPERPSLLEKYSGRAPLGSWLRTIVVNRFYTLMRRRRFEIQPPNGEPHLEQTETVSESSDPDASDLALLLQAALKHAMNALEAEKLLLLRLVYLHGIEQRVLATLWSIHEANISRSLTSAMESLRSGALDYLRTQDDALDLDWDGLLEVCRTFNLEQLFNDS